MRLTDDDRNFGPITYGRSGNWRPLRLVLSSGGGGYSDSDEARNTLTAYAFGWVACVRMPNIIQPYRVKHVARWDAATVERMGRDWYFETHPREYGFCLSDGHLILYFGAQTNDSITTQSWSRFLPWTQWRHVRDSWYGLQGEHLRTAPASEKFDVRREFEKTMPKALFEFEDFDGKVITATTHVEECEWRFGTGWFKWLSLFRKPRIRRSLDIRFSAEVGPEKGSWKGGMVGHGIDMLPGELHEAAFRRYCEQDHESRGDRHRLRFIGPVTA